MCVFLHFLYERMDWNKGCSQSVQVYCLGHPDRHLNLIQPLLMTEHNSQLLKGHTHSKYNVHSSATELNSSQRWAEVTDGGSCLMFFFLSCFDCLCLETHTHVHTAHTQDLLIVSHNSRFLLISGCIAVKGNDGADWNKIIWTQSDHFCTIKYGS